MGTRAAILRNGAVVAACASLLATGYAYAAREFNAGEVSLPLTIEFPTIPAASDGATKQFTGAPPAEFTAAENYLNAGHKIVLGRVINSSVTLKQGPGGSVQVILDHVSMSGDNENSGSSGYFTGAPQKSLVGINLGGIAWTVEIYDSAAAASPIYTWNWRADRHDHEEIDCGPSNHHNYSTVMRIDGPLPPSEVFKRAVRVRVVAGAAEWDHC